MVFTNKKVQFPHQKKNNITNLKRIFNRNYKFQNFQLLVLLKRLVQKRKSQLTRITNFPFANVSYHTCLF